MKNKLKRWLTLSLSHNVFFLNIIIFLKHSHNDTINNILQIRELAGLSALSKRL